MTTQTNGAPARRWVALVAAACTLGSLAVAPVAMADETTSGAPASGTEAATQQISGTSSTTSAGSDDGQTSPDGNSAVDTVDELNTAISQADAKNPTVTLSTNISADSPAVVTVNKNLTIVGAKNEDGSYAATLNNIVFKVTDGAKASFENLEFTGKSRIWDDKATGVAVTGSVMNVDLGTVDNVAAGWGSHAFICGNNEANGTHALMVTIENNTLTNTNQDGGFGLFYDWAALTDGSSISGNTIGSKTVPLKLNDTFDAKNEVGSAITILNGVSNANVKVSGNAIFADTDRRAVVVYQNTSRANTFTVTFDGNTLTNSIASAPFAKVFANAGRKDVDGGKAANLRAVFLSTNTINGQTVGMDDVDTTDSTSTGNSGKTNAKQFGFVATGVQLDKDGKMTVGDVKLGSLKVGEFNTAYGTDSTKLPADSTAGGVNTIEPKYVAQIDKTSYESLQAAVTAANVGDTITLLSDIKLPKAVTITKQLTIDGTKPNTDGKGIANQYTINGQLAFASSESSQPDNSVVKNVHFVFDGTTNYSGGNWANSIRIQAGNNIQITGNTFTLTADAPDTAGRTEGIFIYPVQGKEPGVTISGTEIKDNTFYQASAKKHSNFSVFIDNQSNKGKITNTMINGNMLRDVDGGDSPVMNGYFLGVFDNKVTHGVTSLTVEDNDLSGNTKAGVLRFYGGAESVKINRNKFGASAGYNIYFSRETGDGWGTDTPLNIEVSLSGNEFNGATAVFDDNGLSLSGWKFDDTNIFDDDTIPYKGADELNGTYGVVFLVNGKRVAWQTVEYSKYPSKPEGYKSLTWYYPAGNGIEKYDFNTNPTGGLLKLYANVPTGGNGGGTVTVPDQISGIEIAAKPSKTEYRYGEAFDPDGLKVDMVWSSGKRDVLKPAQWEVAGFDSSRPGVQTLSVKLAWDESKSASFDVLVMFGDVDSLTPHYGEIRTLLERDITRGFGDGTFRGMGSLNRQDLAAFLYRMAGQPEYTPAKEDFVFADVTEATPHYREILWAAKHGVVKGYDMADGTRRYEGDSPILRQDLAAMLWRLAGEPDAGDASFPDVTADTPHREAIEWAKHAGVATGFEDGTFRGGDTIVRQDAAAFLGRVIAKNLIKF